MSEDLFASVNMIFEFEDAQRAQAFVVVVKNRFGLATVVCDQAKVHVLGDDTENFEITRQIKELARWFDATTLMTNAGRF